MKQLAENLWVKHYPLALLGTDLGRTLTIIRMSSGRLVLHSMASFFATDLAEIRALGEPSWLVEAMLLHDTYARQGRDTFPDIPFLAPEVFNQVVNFATQPLLPAPAEMVSGPSGLRRRRCPTPQGTSLPACTYSHADRRGSPLQFRA